MMLKQALVWLGFGGQGHAHPHGHGDHGHGHGAHVSKHGPHHPHGVVDPVIATTERGIWAVKWSFVIAFLFARRRASARFTYGFGRVEDLAGVIVVLIIVCSAIVAGYEAINRLLHPQPIAFLGWVAAAGIIGFVGNEWVALFRIRVGRDIDSVALIADGYHARTDGLTSLAVVLGALGVWLGLPAADPLLGLVITAMIFGIVWQSTKAVFTRLLDGIDPAVIEEIQHAVQHTPEVQEVTQVRVRWVGHRLHAELNFAVSPHLSVAQGHAIATEVRHQLLHHLPHLANATIHIDPLDASGEEHHRIEEHAHGDLPAHAHP